MDFTSITRKDIDRLVPLVTERDAIVDRLAEISKVLGGGASVGSGFVSSDKKSNAKDAKKVRKGSGRSGVLKDAIVQVLKQAPVGGVSVETIAETLNRKPAAIHVWFYTTGKAIKEIKKIGRGLYTWNV